MLFNEQKRLELYLIGNFPVTENPLSLVKSTSSCFLFKNICISLPEAKYVYFL